MKYVPSFLLLILGLVLIGSAVVIEDRWLAFLSFIVGAWCVAESFWWRDDIRDEPPDWVKEAMGWEDDE